MTDAELLALANVHDVLPIGHEQVALLAFARSLIAATREECAKVADKHPGDIGAAIRALTRPPGD